MTALTPQLNERQRLAIFGTAEELVSTTEMRCGRLRVRIEAGAITGVFWHGTEIVRGIQFTFRDAEWGTLAVQAIEEASEESAQGFTYSLAFAVSAQPVSGRLAITGDASGTLTMSVELQPASDVMACRAGLIVLHPLTVAGAPLTVRHGDGQREQMAFPDAISASQPTTDIAGLSGKLGDLCFDMAFEGETFEMEDQRNWSDASFKTYCRPLSLPFPFTLAAGKTVKQAVKIRFEGGAAAAPRANPELRFGATGARPPGLSLALERSWIPGRHQQPLIADLHPVSSRLRFDLTAGEWEADVALTIAAALGEIEIEAVIGDNEPTAGDQLARLHSALGQLGVTPVSMTALPAAYLRSYQPSGPWPAGLTPEGAVGLVERSFPSSLAGSGVFTGFPELNRYPAAATAGAIVTLSTCAIVHSAADRSVIETLETLPVIFTDARQLAGDRPLHLGLAAIGMRTNPYGSAPVPNPGRVRVPMAQDDPRHSVLFGAVFMLGAYAAAASSGVARLCLAAPTGPFGLLRGDTVSAGYHLHAFLAGASTAAGVDVAAPPGLVAVAWRNESQLNCAVGNLTSSTASADLPAMFDALLFGAADTSNGSWQPINRLTLGPHGLAFLRSPAN